jgi:hypothetical protein
MAAGVLWLLTMLISDRTVTPRGPFEAAEFEVGRVDRLARRVPLLLADASPKKDRDVFVQHLGADVDQGWLVFAARLPGQSRDCTLKWRGEAFEDPCTGETVPADGEGLTQYPTRVEDGRLYVDLRGS